MYKWVNKILFFMSVSLCCPLMIAGSDAIVELPVSVFAQNQSNGGPNMTLNYSFDSSGTDANLSRQEGATTFVLSAGQPSTETSAYIMANTKGRALSGTLAMNINVTFANSNIPAAITKATVTLVGGNFPASSPVQSFNNGESSGDPNYVTCAFQAMLDNNLPEVDVVCSLPNTR